MKNHVLYLLLCFLIFSFIGAKTKGEIYYHGINPNIFGSSSWGVQYDKKNHRIIGPKSLWAWYDSWHVVRKQPGQFGHSIKNSLYTLTESYNLEGNKLRCYPWFQLSFFLFKGNLPEKNKNFLIKKVKEKIWEEWKQKIIIIRIDKIKTGTYIITYVRIEQKKLLLREKGFLYLPLTKIIKKGSFSLKGIIANGTYIPVLLKNVILLNPEIFFRAPQQTKQVPYSFFKKKNLNPQKIPLLLIGEEQFIIIYF